MILVLIDCVEKFIITFCTFFTLFIYLCIVLLVCLGNDVTTSESQFNMSLPQSTVGINSLPNLPDKETLWQQTYLEVLISVFLKFLINLSVFYLL